MKPQVIKHLPDPNRPLTRRGLLVSGTTLAASAALGAWAIDARYARATTTGTATTASPSPDLPLLSLPAPTGRYPVGTLSQHLVDRSRIDPLAPTRRYRELMVRLWYPAANSHGPSAPYLPAGVSAVLVGQVNAQAGTDYPAGLLTFPTNSQLGAPMARTSAPMVLFSPGEGFNAELYTGISEELASRGYLVAGIDYTFDAVVEFPDGRVELPPTDTSADYLQDTLLPVRVADTRFVVDQLTSRFHPSTAAAIGHSLGSVTAVQAIDQDPRIDAGAALDGNPLGSVSLTEPFMLMGAADRHRPAVDPDWVGFYAQLRGPRLYQVVDGVEHDDFSDITIFKSVTSLGPGFPVGPLDGARALHIQRVYLTAWFNYALLGRPSKLLGRATSAFPEVEVEAASL